MSTSKTGKHGHAKCNFTALDIFTGKKLEDMCPSTHNVDVRAMLLADTAFCSAFVLPHAPLTHAPGRATAACAAAT